MCLEWKCARHINAEDMTEFQASSFLVGCRELSDVLNAHCVNIPLNEEDSPDHQCAIIADWTFRHPPLARFIKPILSIPERERSYCGHSLFAVHRP